MYRAPMNPQEAKERGKNKTDTNRHHIINKCRGGSDDKSNLVSLNPQFHSRLHQLLGNETPREQLYTILKINQTALKKHIVKELARILEDGDFYKPEAYIYPPDEYV